MYFDELDTFLRGITTNEAWHLEHPGEISERYLSFDSTIIRDQKVFLFDFTNKVFDNGIFILKESRFTHLYPHSHKNIELNYMYSGSCTFYINETEVRLKQGDICFLEPHVIHSSNYIGENDIILTISIDKKIFEQTNYADYERNIISNILINQLIHIRERNQFVIYRKKDTATIELLILTLIYIYFSQRDDNFEITIHRLIHLILKSLADLPFDRTHLDFVNQEDHIIFDVISYIKTHYKKADLRKLADSMNYNYTYLSNTIKSKLGTSFSELKVNQQIIVAKQYLTNSSLSISEIITEIGMTNETYFYRKFKAIVGVAPSTYRKQNHLT